MSRPLSRLIGIVALACAVLVPHVAHAQAQPPNTAGQQTTPPQPRVPRPPVGVHAYGLVELERMAASQSFGAVVGSSIMFGFGGGVDITRLHKGLFARVSFVRAQRSGEGAAVADDEVFPLGVALTATLQTFDFGAGWRFISANPQRRSTPYIGAGLAITSLRETDEFSVPEAVETIRKTGFMFFGGVDWPLGRHGMFGIEGQFRTVPDGLGAAGVSADFGETNLGGLAVRVLVGFRK